MRRFRQGLLVVCAFAGLSVPLSAQQWVGGGLRVELAGKGITVSAGDRPLIRNASIRFGLLEPVDVRVQSSEPDRLRLVFIYPSPADATSGQAASPNGPGSDRPLTALVDVTPVTDGIRFHGDAPWARHLAIRMDDLGDHAFGLIEWLYPDNGLSPDLRGHVVPLDVEGDASRMMENYADAASAFYISSLGYGSFFDSFARGRYSFGLDGHHEIYHETGSLDWYLFYGPGGAQIHRGYFSVIGRPKRLPLWAVGPVVWRDQNNGGKEEVLDDLSRFAALHIPLTALWLDRPYSNGVSGWSEMDFSPKFADPAAWIRTVRQQYGMEVMTWIAPQVFDPANPFPGNFRNPNAYFDLSNPAAVAEFDRRLAQRQYAFGVRGHKMDRAEEFFPLYQRWADSTPGPAQRTKYLYLYARVTDGMLNKAWGADNFNFARGTYHRAQPFLSAVWGGDSRSSWAGMRANLANGIRAGFMGFPVWGSDVGGYLGIGHIPEDLYARWLELGSWSGLFEVKLDGAGGSGEDRPPWKYSPALQAIFRDATERRMQMLPTLYSLANTSATSGVLMQPLAYVFPGDTATFAIWDEYLLGGMFLVAPVLTPGDSRSVYFPAGRWTDLADPARTVEGPRRMQVRAPLDSIPVYVRAGSVYVTGDVFDGSSRRWRTDGRRHTLTVHAYPHAAEGRTVFTFVDPLDAGKEKDIVLTTRANGASLAAPAMTVAGDVVMVLDHAPQRVSVGGRALARRYDEIGRSIRVPFSAGRPIAVEVAF